MTTVLNHAVPTPETSTPSPHACHVSAGSCPMVRSNTQAAPTETANCSQIIRPIYQKETARG